MNLGCDDKLVVDVALVCENIVLQLKKSEVER